MADRFEILIRQNRSFVIYRAPKQEPILLIQSSENLVRLEELEELNGQTGFVFAPFQITDSSPLVLMKPDCTITGWTAINDYLSQQKIASPIKSDNSDCLESNHYDTYQEAFSSFIGSLREERFEKLVLSRTAVYPKESDFSTDKAFDNACQRYTDAFVYLFHSAQTGTWLGSTPEIILSGKEECWKTVALAGTLPYQQAVLPNAWNEKNSREQQLVADYVRTQLNSFGIEPNETVPFTVKAGELAHLKSEFTFPLVQSNCLGNLLKLLHPTPAVCGLPKEAAYRFILENEGYDRRYYSGFVGWIDPQGSTDLYVNLRCMEIEEVCLTLYAGGGLLSRSELDSEWNETEDKLQTMLAIIK